MCLRPVVAEHRLLSTGLFAAVISRVNMLTELGPLTRFAWAACWFNKCFVLCAVASPSCGG